MTLQAIWIAAELLRGHQVIKGGRGFLVQSSEPHRPVDNMSYRLKSLMGVRKGLYRVPIMGLMKGEAGSLDYGSYEYSVIHLGFCSFRSFLQNSRYNP